MNDPFKNKSVNITDPSPNAFAITPHDTNELPSVTRAIYVGETGDIKCILANNTVAVTFVNATAGTILPIRVKQVLNTGTSALNLLGLQ